MLGLCFYITTLNKICLRFVQEKLASYSLSSVDSFILNEDCG